MKPLKLLSLILSLTTLVFSQRLGSENRKASMQYVMADAILANRAEVIS